MLLRMRTRMIQVRNVPEDVHRTLKARAAQAGMSLSDYLRTEIVLLARRPTFAELFEELSRDGPKVEGLDAAEVVRQGREERDRELMRRILPDLPEP